MAFQCGFFKRFTFAEFTHGALIVFCNFREIEDGNIARCTLKSISEFATIYFT